MSADIATSMIDTGNMPATMMTAPMTSLTFTFLIGNISVSLILRMRQYTTAIARNPNSVMMRPGIPSVSCSGTKPKTNITITAAKSSTPIQGRSLPCSLSFSISKSSIFAY